MSLDSPESPNINAAACAFGIVAARFNAALVDRLLQRVVERLKLANVAETNLSILRVPGSNEIPYAAAGLANPENLDCVICLGVVIAGATAHHEVIAFGTANALHAISTEAKLPVINGIIVANTENEAKERTSGLIDRGKEFAEAALEMALLKQQFVNGCYPIAQSRLNCH